MEKTLTKKDFSKWMKTLAAHELYAPRKDGEIWNFDIIRDSAAVELDFLNTVVPSKKIIYPQWERLLQFKKSDTDGFQVEEILPEPKPAVVFGLRPCEGKAFLLMDKVFGGDFEDTYYWKRRKATTLIGLTCAVPPSPNCFCLSVEGSPHSKEGLDILLTDIGEKILVEALTEKGKKLLQEAKQLLKEPTPDDRKKAEKLKAEAEKKVRRQVKNLKEVTTKLKGMFDSPFWDEESMSCIRCGICTYLCPTCHCFDMNDEVETSSPLSGKRVRTWDTCQFPDFTMHSSGHNPRPDKASRLRQRINHKFQYFVEIHQKYQCTGCGRCISYCPVGIDLIKVLEKVKEYGA
ncbi:MAG: 4Fe-4S dicluster domain-containing protein [Candidatus Aminicenantales bacterium]